MKKSEAKMEFKEWMQLNERKDACYHKVKRRYKVWPSAYASGALVKCRKVGAANWGNKTDESKLSVNESELKVYIKEKINLI